MGSEGGYPFGGSRDILGVVRLHCGVGAVCSNNVMLDHIALQCGDPDASAAFYDAVLAPLGCRRLVDSADAIGFGRDHPMFWLGPRRTGEGFRETHIAFTANDRKAVNAFFAAAIRNQAEVLYEPQVWPNYHPDYFAAFVRDPDGNNVEAVCHQAPR